MKNISVIGAGTMGNGIAHVFAQSGFKVSLIDISDKALEKGIATIAKNLDRMVAKEKITEQEKNSYSCAVRTVIKIKRYLGQKLDLINNSIVLESESKIAYNKESHQRVLALEDKITDLYEAFSKTINEALKEGIPLEQISAILQK
jgi:3-hydroxybutyryl-CoA dehydrogenase